MVDVVASAIVGGIVALIAAAVFWGRASSAQRDFRRALVGKKQLKRARFDPPENIAAFRKVLGPNLMKPLASRELDAIRRVAPELAVFLEYEIGNPTATALTELEQQLEIGRDDWWRSIASAEGERARFADRAAALKDGASDKGQCPDCGAVIRISSHECPRCNARFTGRDTWKVRPLTVQNDG